MLTVTEAAGAHMARVLAEAEGPDDAALRIVPVDEGLALRVDSEHPGDATFAHEGKTVLVLDERMAESLAERTLDVQDAGEGPRLTLA
jgi:Fe-S cluster assembly iron-binding protein IscA